MTVKTHSFRGKRYRMKWDGAWYDDAKGETDTPANPKRAITILKGLAGRELLDTLIHESLHACMWDLDDEAVTETATDIARLLWRLGYRPSQSTEV